MSEIHFATKTRLKRRETWRSKINLGSKQNNCSHIPQKKNHPWNIIQIFMCCMKVFTLNCLFPRHLICFICLNKLVKFSVIISYNRILNLRYEIILERFQKIWKNSIFKIPSYLRKILTKKYHKFKQNKYSVICSISQIAQRCSSGLLIKLFSYISIFSLIPSFEILTVKIQIYIENFNSKIFSLLPHPTCLPEIFTNF